MERQGGVRVWAEIRENSQGPKRQEEHRGSQRKLCSGAVLKQCALHPIANPHCQTSIQTYGTAFPVPTPASRGYIKEWVYFEKGTQTIKKT